ncbi:aminopeptidase RNPEPL1 isoform X2 [Chrysemys picta bellii]|uniref:aminopeptidase RNPEPL1 isoform X2 n=1 Tax=Chrysemys picta bellii TaxID=8478 RepID=UPI0032B2E6FB
MAAPAPRPPGLCCCRKGPPPGPEAPPAPPPPPPEPPPDVASASSSQLFRLRHLQLGLELRPAARALAGCLVLELCALRARPRALVLDTHPALRVLSAGYRRAPAGEGPCAFGFPAGPGPLPAEPLLPCGSACALTPLLPDPSTASSSPLSAPSTASTPLSAPATPGLSPDPGAQAQLAALPSSPPACPSPDCPPAPDLPPPPFPTFPDPSAASCPLVFRVDPFTEYGSSLTISLPAALQPHQPFQIIVRYTTTDGPAIWWLDPELTCGKAKPFVFTQGHSVCNRSFFPCFDTPAVKCTYSATVKAPAGIQVLMSATQSTYLEQEGVYQFYMEYPVPAYLVALVAGDLISADIGPRSRVWAEPCLLPTAISKLSGMVERWLSAAESLYGPYIWGRYDIVFLPPSFPIVAMENPCLTFIISSILESDDFLIIDVIHEIAHSWFGNAVTNATWEEMWLSEGLATYAQRRITTETYGAAFTCLETAFRLDALHRQMKLLGEDNPVSKLQVKLEPGVNPSNLMNLFTYEKGYCFVYYLSQLCGDPKHFDSFLRAYIEKYKFTSVVAQDLLDSFLNFFPELKEQSVDNKAEVIKKLSECYSSQLDTMNAEIRIRWLQIVVRNDYYPDFYKVRHFLEYQMSRMYTIPLYEDICTGTLKSFALEVFYQTQNQLHPNLRKTIQQILTQGLNPLPTTDTTAVATDTPTMVLEDKPSEAANSAISLRDVNVSA